jgi:hypothetical protein
VFCARNNKAVKLRFGQPRAVRTDLADEVVLQVQNAQVPVGPFYVAN